MAIYHHLDPDLLIGGYLLYSVVLISAVQHYKSVIYIYICVCVCVYVYIYIYVYVCTHSHPIEPHSHHAPFLKGNCHDFSCLFSLLNKQGKYFVKVIQILLGF